MGLMRIAMAFLSACFAISSSAEARVWTDDTGHYTLEAELVAVGDSVAVLKREDRELVAFPLEWLSAADREYLKSEEAVELAKKIEQSPQTWTLRDGTQLQGRLVDYAKREVTIQRRRGRIYVNDRAFDNLPEFYRELLPRIVAHVEDLPRADRRTFQQWVTDQRGRPETYQLEGVVLEVESGDEYAVPFFLFSDEDAKLLEGGWDEWLADVARESVADLPEACTTLAECSWGRVNVVRIRHPVSESLPFLARFLDMPAVPLPGDWSVPRVQSRSFGASERFAVSPGREELGYFHMPGGQSGHPLSPFYRAGHAAWVHGKAAPFLPGTPVHRLSLRPAL